MEYVGATEAVKGAVIYLNIFLDSYFTSKPVMEEGSVETFLKKVIQEQKKDNKVVFRCHVPGAKHKLKQDNSVDYALFTIVYTELLLRREGAPLLQEIEQFMNMGHAIFMADIGMMERMIPWLPVYFLGTEQNKYRTEMLHLYYLSKCAKTPEMKTALFSSMLISQKTRKQRINPIDLCVEHFNNLLAHNVRNFCNSTHRIKEVYKARSKRTRTSAFPSDTSDVENARGGIPRWPSKLLENQGQFTRQYLVELIEHMDTTETVSRERSMDFELEQPGITQGGR
ncbi:hypothetical protein KEM56_000300 [Ascosphaera pollenicola]|nr:hypothetical protein KEM56_000300 [Ascosphaera pollenicola]